MLKIYKFIIYNIKYLFSLIHIGRITIILIISVIMNILLLIPGYIRIYSNINVCIIISTLIINGYNIINNNISTGLIPFRLLIIYFLLLFILLMIYGIIIYLIYTIILLYYNNNYPEWTILFVTLLSMVTGCLLFNVAFSYILMNLYSIVLAGILLCFGFYIPIGAISCLMNSIPIRAIYNPTPVSALLYLLDFIITFLHNILLSFLVILFYLYIIILYIIIYILGLLNIFIYIIIMIHLFNIFNIYILFIGFIILLIIYCFNGSNFIYLLLCIIGYLRYIIYGYVHINRCCLLSFHGIYSTSLPIISLNIKSYITKLNKIVVNRSYNSNRILYFGKIDNILYHDANKSYYSLSVSIYNYNTSFVIAGFISSDIGFHLTKNTVFSFTCINNINNSSIDISSLYFYNPVSFPNIYSSSLQYIDFNYVVILDSNNNVSISNKLYKYYKKYKHINHINTIQSYITK